MKKLILLTMAAVLSLCSGCGPSRREEALKLAPQVSEFGAARFGDLDLNKDGNISATEVALALESVRFSEAEKALLRHVQSNMDLIGHVISKEEVATTDMIPISDGNGGFTYIFVPSTETRYHYGVSKDDFQTYPDRLKKQ